MTPSRFFLSLLVLGLCSSGCVNLKQSYPDIRTYSIDVKRTADVQPVLVGWSLRVEDFRVVKAFEDIFLTYRISNSNYETDFYNQFLTAPEEMLTKETAEWLTDTEYFEFVTDGSSRISTSHALEGDVHALYADYRKESEPNAVLEILLSLVEEIEGERTVVFQKTYEQSVAFEHPSAKLLVQAWNEGLRAILSAFEKDLMELL